MASTTGTAGSWSLSAASPPSATPSGCDMPSNARVLVSAEELPTVYRALIDADDRGDAAALARIGWQLFAMTSAAQQAHRHMAHLLGELRAAAGAAAAGQGSPASIALLRHVLAKNGWLPPAGATPLQVLAAPHGHDRPGGMERPLAAAALRPSGRGAVSSGG